MSLKNYHLFETTLSKNGFENVFTVDESLAIAEDITLSESTPERIMDELVESYGERATELDGIIRETFKDIFECDDEEEEDEEEDDVDEGMRPKRLTGRAKMARDEKSHLMKLGNGDEEISKIKELAKKKIVQRLKALGRKNGIKVNKVNFEKIKL